MLKLSDAEKSKLLKIAREAIDDFLRDKTSAPAVEESEALHQKCGAFVTIKNKGKLRGCIGQIVSDNPLYKTVEEMAVSAATSDPRFAPLTRVELPEVDLEISVLSPFRTIKDFSEITVGDMGLFIKRGHSQGLLLPQVATENNWNREQFIEHTCIKAGLPRDAWKDPAVEIQVFSAFVFGEK